MKHSILAKTYRQLKGDRKDLIFSGYTELDERLGGFERATLHLLAARPGMGATSLALGMATAMAKNKKRVLYYSLDANATVVVRKLIAQEIGDEKGHIRLGGNLTEEELKKTKEALEKLKKLPILIDDVQCQEVESLANSIVRNADYLGADIIFVDYLQMISSSEQYHTGREETEKLVKRLRYLAGVFDIPILLLSDLPREIETRQDHYPRLSDLYSLGLKPRWFDSVLFLYRDEYYTLHTEFKGIGEVIIAGNRRGRIGVVNLAWIPEYCKFLNLLFVSD